MHLPFNISGSKDKRLVGFRVLCIFRPIENTFGCGYRERALIAVGLE
jgi:hypothetical protein